MPREGLIKTISGYLCDGPSLSVHQAGRFYYLSYMLKSYLTITFRNLMRNKVFSLLNIFGLAIGISSCFLIWQYVKFESSYDTFHEHADRLYRVPVRLMKQTTRVDKRFQCSSRCSCDES